MCLHSGANPLGCRDSRLGLHLPSTPSDGSSHGESGGEETVECRVRAVSGYLGEPTSIAEHLCSELEF